MGKIIIENLKSIARMEFDIPTSGIHVLTGVNGSGKTTLLAFLQRLTDSYAFQRHFRSSSNNQFDNYYTRDKKALLRWPFPMLLVLDIGGRNDLDLNSARNEILYNEKWDYLEQDLAYIICKGVYEKVDNKYWLKHKEILLNQTKSDNFINGLNKLSVEVETSMQCQ